MEPQKFEISGEIESSEPQPKRARITGRLFLFALVIVVVSGVLYFPYLQDTFPALKKITMGAGNDDSLQIQRLSASYAIDSIQHVNDSLKQANNLLLENSADNTGLFYEVQIGAFKNFDLEKYKENLAALHGISEDGYSKLTLGKFRELKMAREFLKDVREIGFKDAWIVAKENGQRVPFDNAVLGEEMP